MYIHHTYMHAYIHTYIHIYIHICAYTYVHTYVHTYIQCTSLIMRKNTKLRVYVPHVCDFTVGLKPKLVTTAKC